MKRGFGSPNYDTEIARVIQRQGGRASQATGKAHRWTSAGAGAARAGAIGGRTRLYREHVRACSQCSDGAQDPVPMAALCQVGRTLRDRLIVATGGAVITAGILGAFGDAVEDATAPRRACWPKVQHLVYNAALAQRKQLLDRGLTKNPRRIHVYRCAECSRRLERSVFHVGHPAC